MRQSANPIKNKKKTLFLLKGSGAYETRAIEEDNEALYKYYCKCIY